MFQLLRDYEGQPVDGWLMSEKLDGWRVMVHGSRLVTRGGHFLAAPAWFMDGLPDGLDGELFAGRGGFYGIQGAMRDGWRGLTFQAFDAAMPGAYRQRLAFIKALSLPAHVGIVKQVRCADTRQLVEFADAIVTAGGEGAVVRDPRARWVAGRSESVLRWVPQCPRLNRRRTLRERPQPFAQSVASGGRVASWLCS